MRLLIVTQAIDMNDPILGFFHRWVEEFAKHCESIVIICLFEGAHRLPENVRVYSLGKEKGGVGRLTYAWRFRRLLKTHADEYDGVFVHMNPEYILLGGRHWRRSGKKVALWYVHKSITLSLRLAMRFVSAVFTASPESFRLKSGKVHVIGHGIDTDFFSPDPSVKRSDAVLSVGRLMKSKRHDLAIRVAAEGKFPLRIAGEGEERSRLKLLARDLGADVRFLGGLTQAQLRDEYRKAAYLIHTSETGSVDKVVLEALSCATPVVTTSEAFENTPAQYLADATPASVAKALATMPRFSDALRAYVVRNHSLTRLIPRILALYT